MAINNIVGVAIAGIGENEIFISAGDLAGFSLAKELEPQGKVMFALQILHTYTMPIVKASVLVFYLRTFPTRRFKIAVCIVPTFVLLWWVSILLATIFQCNPISDNWGTQPSRMSGCISDINIVNETAAVTNLVSDVILALPFLIVWKPHVHKVAVSRIFLAGAV